MQQTKLSLNLSYAILIFILVSIFAAGSFFRQTTKITEKEVTPSTTLYQSTWGKVVSIDDESIIIKNDKNKEVKFSIASNVFVFEDFFDVGETRYEDAKLTDIKEGMTVAVSYLSEKKTIAVRIDISIQNNLFGKVLLISKDSIKIDNGISNVDIKLTDKTSYYEQTVDFNAKDSSSLVTSAEKQITKNEIKIGDQISAYLTSSVDDSNSTAETIMIMEIK